MSIVIALGLAGVGCSGEQGEPGPPGPKGDPGGGNGLGPSISGVIPRTGVLDRELDVIVIGNATSFDESTVLNFGDGVEVVSQQIASPTAMFAHLRIDKAAVPGTRDLTVTGNSPASGAKVFEIVPAIGVQMVGGKAEQGSVADIAVINNDRSAFAASYEGARFGIQGGGASSVVTRYVTATDARFLVLFDPKAPTGPAQLQGANFFSDDAVPAVTFQSKPDALTINARTPTDLTAGATLNGQTLPNAYDTGFYRLQTNGAPQVVTVTVKAPTSSADDAFEQVLYAFSESGRFEDIYGWTRGCSSCVDNSAVLRIPVEGARGRDLFFVVGDASFRGGDTGNFAYSISTSVIAGSSKDEQTTPHDTLATAQAVSFGTSPVVISGRFEKPNEIDVYAIPAQGSSAEVEVALWSQAGNVAAYAVPVDPKTITYPYVAVWGGDPAHKLESGRIYYTPGTWSYIAVRNCVYGCGSNPTGKYVVSFRKIN